MTSAEKSGVEVVAGTGLAKFLCERALTSKLYAFRILTRSIHGWRPARDDRGLVMYCEGYL